MYKLVLWVSDNFLPVYVTPDHADRIDRPFIIFYKWGANQTVFFFVTLDTYFIIFIIPLIPMTINV